MRSSATTWLVSLAVLAIFVTGCSAPAVRETGHSAETPKKASRQATRRPYVNDRINYRSFDYYMNGLMAQQAGDYATAAEQFRRSLDYFPESFEIAYALAESYYYLGEPEKSLEVLSRMSVRNAAAFRLSAACYRVLNDVRSYHASYRNLVRVDPNDVEAYSILGSMYMAQGEADSAVWAYRHMARLDPGNPRVWSQLGIIYARQDRTDSALEAYRTSVANDSSISNISSIFAVAELHRQADRLDSAVVWYEKALVLDSTNRMLLGALASIHGGRDQWLQALPYARRLALLEPDDPEPARYLGMLYMQMDSLDAADSVLQTVLAGGSDQGWVHQTLGYIALEQEDWQRAVNELRAAVLSPDSLTDVTAAWLGVGVGYRGLDQLDQEITTYRQALENVQTDDDRLRLMFALASTYERAGRMDEAVVVFENLLELDPEYHPALNYLGYMLADAGQRLDEAHEMISRAVEMAPDNAAYLDSYGWVYFRLGEFAKAIQYLEQAVELDNDPVIFDHLGDAYHATGDRERAREWWRKALELQPDNAEIKEKLAR